MATVRKAWELILDIFFPPICLSCKKYLETAEKPNLICDFCLNGIWIYKTLFRLKPNLLLAAATSYENPAVRELIHYFKYEAFLQAQKSLSEILIKYLSGLNLCLENYIVVPIPLHPSRKRKRGFNQAEILAEAVSKHFGRGLATRVIKRVKETKSQIEIKDYKARGENVKDCFALDKNASEVKGKSILLVDDVYTSGATIKEAIKMLRKAGAKEIITLVVAKAD